ncbi:hypothetical protein A2382_00420 [Candidatus Woesebacteria bacterium RIFOXYB1_FULL_38_16]|uniref:Uncharacterized protein n=1 Tax=Candidatus Woesebacteria bacterium RIFOXYB1_FULL_38_16 TaxID=1802538 RepID=A0A1F8CSD8_9BACT|nr:MAG: hypothetical protein A2191_01300 [Candidatus Woesebacteria bacterium RIFOXYA1_FULL_38_9]OGM79234.1 MAG: hypothetical protein A2382_00420 [Candidatus Woesebacteria bacterium RIFOXYB1_FULL_38_16]
MSERGSGRPDIWRLKLQRAQLFATKVSERVVTANPGKVIERETIILQHQSVQDHDLRQYSLDENGNFILPPIKKD